MCVKVKHAFITRFNELSSTVYRDYTVSLAYDMAQTRQKTAFSDPSDLIARRMGFIPLPLSVAMGRVLCTTLTPSARPANLILLILAYLILVALRILNSLIILGRACDLISSHAHSNKNDTGEETLIQNVNKSSADVKDPNLATAIFSNSAVSLNNVCLNDALLKSDDDNDELDRSEDNSAKVAPPVKNFLRSGSEPLLPQ